MTLNDLLQDLRAMPSEAPLAFVTGQGPIKGGYHVTELKQSKVTSIDCGARVTEWSEATLQLLDGSGGQLMSVAKFTAIVGQSVTQLTGLGDLSARVEFAAGNVGMRTYDIATPVANGDEIIVGLSEVTALCKPGKEVSAAMNSKSCCG